jgi:hypothetical protein
MRKSNLFCYFKYDWKFSRYSKLMKPVLIEPYSFSGADIWLWVLVFKIPENNMQFLVAKHAAKLEL